MGVGNAPGLLLSFVLVSRLSPSAADVMLLGISSAIVTTGILVSTLEAAFTVSFGVLKTKKPGIEAQDFRAARRGAVMLSGIPSLLVCPSILMAYISFASHSDIGPSTILHLWPVLLFPFVAAQSAVWSSALLAASNFPAVFLSAGLRGTPTIVAAFITHDLQILALTYLLGEILRCLSLRKQASQLISRQAGLPTGTDPEVLDVPTLRGWIQQLASMSLSQSTVIIGRALLATQAVGSVSQGDAAEKIAYIANQISLSGVVLPSVAGMPEKLESKGPVEARRIVLRNLQMVFVFSLIPVSAIAVCITAALVIKPPLFLAFETILTWALIFLAASPFLSASVWSSRIILLGEKTILLPVAAGISLLVGLAGGVVLRDPLGAVGVIIATSLAQISSGLVFIIILCSNKSIYCHISSRLSLSERVGVTP